MDKFPKTSVIVCTKDRPEDLERCLRSLMQLRYKSYEVIVVDNNSLTKETKKVASQFPVKYILEKELGLDRARNRGIMEAKGEIVAFTDDDCVVDRHWLNILVSNLGNPNVGCCTGMVRPLELRTTPQKIFEEYQTFLGHSYRMDFTKDSPIPFFPVNIFRVGAGANMAFRKETLTAINYFDEEMDVGTLAMCGGDILAFFKIITSGWKVTYDPRAIVWHKHPSYYRQLIKKIYGYGVGCQFYLLKCIISAPDYRVQARLYRLIWFPYQIVRLIRKLLSRPRISFFPLAIVETSGALIAPWYWYRLRKATPTAKKFNGSPIVQ